MRQKAVSTVDFELVDLPPAPSPHRDGDAVALVRVRGDIDVTNAASLRAALAQRAGAALVVDLSEVGYFDSAGFAVLDQLLGEARLAIVVAPGSVVRTAMSLLNLPFHDGVDAALGALRPA